jgi:hypothetical protein
MQLARRHRRRLLAEAVDPDDGHAEGDRRSDVVEEARGDVDVSTRVDVAALRKNAPVRGRRLVRADFGSDDRRLSGDADLLLIPRQVRSLFDGQRDANPGAQPPQRHEHLRERVHPGSERLSASDSAPAAQALRRARRASAIEHLRYIRVGSPPAAGSPRMVQEPRRGARAEEPLELAADPAVPVVSVRSSQMCAAVSHGGGLRPGAEASSPTTTPIHIRRRHHQRQQPERSCPLYPQKRHVSATRHVR